MPLKKYKPTLNTRFAFACLVLLAGIGFLAGTFFQVRENDPPQADNSIAINVDMPELKKIVLQSHRGLATNWGSYSNSLRVVFFGYTFCPDICPLGLANVAGAVDILNQNDLELTPVFITVDPKRDTPEVLKEYVSAFHKDLEGLTGKDEGIKSLASAFLAYYEVAPETANEEYYLIDHTSYIYLVGKSGALLGYYHMSLSPRELADAITNDMTNSG